MAHRDVKPDNVLWDPVSRHAKLTDFGTALLLREDHGRLGADFVRPRGGTLAFYAPEMCITDANHRCARNDGQPAMHTSRSRYSVAGCCERFTTW